VRYVCTVTRIVTHFVDVEVEAIDETNARSKALNAATTDHRYWDDVAADPPQVVHVRQADC
jgi:hypothetical protein